jgi:hypothetical protein
MIVDKKVNALLSETFSKTAKKRWWKEEEEENERERESKKEKNMIMETHFCHFTKSSKFISYAIAAVTAAAVIALLGIPFNHKLDEIAM